MSTAAEDIHNMTTTEADATAAADAQAVTIPPESLIEESKTTMSEDADWDQVNLDEDEDVVIDTPSNDSESFSTRRSRTPKAKAVQIVSIGTESNQYAFTFHEEALQSILKDIPSDMKVCVVSVVGAFRTGKSFLLSWFLRYLSHFEHEHSIKDNTSTAEEESTKWYEQTPNSTLGQSAFHWRGGSERNTTGIWMWSKPYILPNKNHTVNTETNNNCDDQIAVLLVDTQGMFDHETTMALTAAIFGLSTLLSSYQIYNVDKRIQEDNLQQLALFSEYGRMAIDTDFDLDDNDNENENQNRNESNEQDKLDDNDDELLDSKQSKESDDPIEQVVEKEQTKEATNERDTPLSSTSAKTTAKPFQLIEFLVRDWQNFEDEDDFEACENEMKQYLENVLAERDAADLKDTREQITSCFENVNCFLMVHPGKAVTKKTYDGDIDCIDPTFKDFMHRYCTRVFEHLVPKSIHGRELTAMELGSYIRNYAKMFETGAHFPEAATMLEATSNANNTNAQTMSIKQYKDEMDSVAGAQQTNYMNPVLLEEFHRTVLSQSMKKFDDIACFGNKRAIEECRKEVIRSIQEQYEVYSKLNEGRNPLAGLETYIIPLTIGLISISLRWVADWTCTSWSQTCKAGSDFLSHVYQVVFFFLVILASTKAKQISQAAERMKKAWDVMHGASGVNNNNQVVSNQKNKLD